MLSVSDNITEHFCKPPGTITVTFPIIGPDGVVVGSMPSTIVDTCPGFDPLKREERRTVVRPTATFGIGVERDFGRFFARVDGEARHIFYNDDAGGNGITQFDASSMLGVRF